MKKCIKEIRKRENVIIRICTEELMGYRYVEVRQYYKEKDNEYKPSKKGFSIRLECLDELISGLLEAKKEFSQGTEPK